MATITTTPRPPRKRYITKCGGKSRTEQHHKKKCDINRIVKKYIQTGLMEQNAINGLYGDFTSVDDYMTSLLKIQDAQNDFMTLPSIIRKRFDNDPGKLIEFVSKAENKEEAIRLGLVPKEAEPEAQTPPEPAPAESQDPPPTEAEQPTE